MTLVSQKISNGNYFLHLSLLKDASESWILRKQETNSGRLFMKLVGSKGTNNMELCACDRTLQKMSELPHKIGFLPAIFDLISEKTLRAANGHTDDEYCLKVASLKATLPFPTYLIVADNEKEKITALAKERGFHSVKILSPLDFDA